MVDFYKKNSDIFLMIFAFISFISMSLGNIAMGLALGCFFLTYSKKEYYLNYNIKYYLKILTVFTLAMLVTSLQSQDFIYSIKCWLNDWVWRISIFVIVSVSLQRNKKLTDRSAETYKRVQRLFIAIFAGFTINNLCIIYNGLSTGMRATGFYGYYMMHAGFLCILLPVLLIAIIQKDLIKINRCISFTIFVIGCIALIFNSTRGAWLAMLVIFLSIGIIYVWNNKKLGFAILIIILSILVGLSTNGKIHKRFISALDVSQHSERILVWNSAINMFKDYPIMGVGEGQYKKMYQNKYISPLAKEPYLTHAHNNILQMLAEHGIIGCISFLFLIFSIIWRSAKRFLKNKNPWHLMIISSTLALQIQGLTEYNFGQSGVMKCYWLVLACLVLMAELKDEGNA